MLEVEVLLYSKGLSRPLTVVKQLDYFKPGGVGKPHINIRWSDDGSDENERVYRYRLD